MNDPAPTTISEHCNNCLGSRNHVIVHTIRTEWSEKDAGETVMIAGEAVMIVGEGDMWEILTCCGGDTWELMRCLGCDTVKLKHKSWCDANEDDYGRPRVHTEYFPPSISRQEPPWRRKLVLHNEYLDSCDAILYEIYGALALGAHRLATMGVRALVERLMISQVQDQGTFENNIKAFFAAGHVAPMQQGMFRDTLIDAGHAAMHRDFAPSADTVNTLLDIVEGIMHLNYYAPMLAEMVKETIPARR